VEGVRNLDSVIVVLAADSTVAAEVDEFLMAMFTMLTNSQGRLIFFYIVSKIFLKKMRFPVGSTLSSAAS
jgi:hypothetical protein